MFAAVMSVLLLAGVETGPPASTPAPAAAAQAPVKAKPADMVCVEEAPTGTHFPKRVCMTREQAEQVERQSKDALTHRNEPVKGGFGPH